MSGLAVLVGAGPGDPGLLTVAGAGWLKRADVVIYDRLANEELLAECRPEAELIYVGKSGAHHTLSQAEINRLLVDRAGQGKLVVRLKGGDPFVFGRGGEEAQALAQAGIRFAVVPGVSSAVAAPAYAGVPVTQRGVASSLGIFTGHEEPGKAASALQWEHLASGTDTLVFLMGLENLQSIVQNLISHGRSPDSPTVVVADGTLPTQQVVESPLSSVPAAVATSGLRPPAVLVVGDVVRLRAQLRWFDNQPLFGKRVLVTRAKAQASALSCLLRERGARPIELPVIEVSPLEDNSSLDAKLQRLADYRWIVFTSANAVGAVFARTKAMGLDARSFHGARICAIGPATASALEGHGLRPDLVPQESASTGVLAALRQHVLGGAAVLLPRADIASEDLSHGLREAGARVDEVVAYRTTPAPGLPEAASAVLSSARPDAVTFASSSSVRNLVDALRGDLDFLEGAVVACIGPVTADTARAAGLRVDVVASEYTIQGLVSALEHFFEKEAVP